MLPLHAWVDQGNERVLYIPQSYGITGASPSDCLVSYPGHYFKVGDLPASAEMQLVYSTTPLDLAIWQRDWINRYFYYYYYYCDIIYFESYYARDFVIRRKKNADHL